MPNIIAEIREYLNRYMVFPNEDQSFAVALWALSTWTFSPAFPRTPWTTPYLYIHSEESRSGKTLLLDLLEPITLNPERAVDMTSSVLFRLIEKIQPTLLIDEVDAIWSGAKNEAMRGVLNGGYKRNGYVWRTVPGPDGPEPTKFGTFSPKILAGIDNGMLPETIQSRCIPIHLRRVGKLNENGELEAPDGTTREIFYEYMAGPVAAELVPKVDQWVRENGEKIIGYLPKPTPGMNPRAWEVCMPLVQLAAAAGMETEAREALARLTAPQPVKDTPGIAMLRAIKTAFDEADTDRLFTDVLLAATEFSSGKLLSKRLEQYEVGPTNGITIRNKRGKGYYRHQFTDAWERYL